MSILRYLVGAALAGAAIVASPASAAPILQYQILNGSTVIGSGSTTSGNVIFSGSDNRFTVVSGNAVSAPLLTVPDFSTNAFSLQVGQAATAATLTIRVSATDLTGYAGGDLLNTFTLNSLNGGAFKSGTISTYLDNSNTAYGTGTLIATDTYAGLQQFSSRFSTAVTPASTFSQTAIYTFNFAAGGISTISASSQLTAAVPEPDMWAMMLVGFGMIGAISRYRRRTFKASFA